jgi:hypothetical protein
MISDDFDAVPDMDGEPLTVANSEEEFDFYVEWLADYLYRPQDGQGHLSFKEARGPVIGIEMEIIDLIWTNHMKSIDDLDSTEAKHMDFYHRRRLSGILSQVADRHDRVALVHYLYRELLIDLYK